jgi:hypothetical protein
MAKNLASRIGVAAPLLDNATNPMINMKSTSIAVIVPLEVVVIFFDRKIGVDSIASSYPDDGGENGMSRQVRDQSWFGWGGSQPEWVRNSQGVEYT